MPGKGPAWAAILGAFIMPNHVGTIAWNPHGRSQRGMAEPPPHVALALPSITVSLFWLQSLIIAPEGYVAIAGKGGEGRIAGLAVALGGDRVARGPSC